MRNWRVLARHKWVSEATITESISVEDGSIRRFTATICGSRDFMLYEGDIRDIDVNKVVEKVVEIRERINAGDKNVFHEDVTIQPRVDVKCTYANGDTVTTPINLTFKEAENYFLGQTFNIGSVDDNLQECVKVERV